jgi:predicted ATPase
MKLTVRNLGAIKSGEVDFADKSLIVFTGPNNTGKSYLTYLIHALFKCNTLTNEEKTYDFIHELFLKSPYVVNEVKQNQKLFLKDIVYNNRAHFDSFISKTILENLTKIYATNQIKPSISVTIDEFNFYKTDNEDAADRFHLIGMEIINNSVFGLNTNGVPYTKELKFQDQTPSQTLITYASVMLSHNLADLSYFGRSYIFPAERTAINLFARDIVSKKAGSRDEMALRVLSGEDIQEIARSISQEQNTTPKYPLSVNDYLSFVNGFEGSDFISNFNHIAQDLESNIVGGSISVSEFKQIVFQPIDAQEPLNLHESSSLVKSLSFLVIYLRHFARKGDWIIIDEPEINLHPNRQVAIARIFAKMINAGLKLVLSTHSDYLIKELNTLVLLHDLHERPTHQEFIKKQGYIKDELLNKRQVGAYYFEKGKVNSINVETTGIVVPTIDTTIAKIDNLAEEIYFKLSTPDPTKPIRKKKA